MASLVSCHQSQHCFKYPWDQLKTTTSPKSLRAGEQAFCRDEAHNSDTSVSSFLRIMCMQSELLPEIVVAGEHFKARFNYFIKARDLWQ